MKDEFGKDTFLAVAIAILGTLLLNANTLIATWRNNKAKDRETDTKADDAIRADLLEVSKDRRQSWIDCKEELAAEKAEGLAKDERIRELEAEKMPLKRQIERERRARECAEESMIACNLLCRYPRADHH